MFKKLLSSFTLMLLCVLSASAQDVQTKRLNAGLNPKFASIPATSTLTLADNEYWWGYWDGVFDNDMRILGVGQNTNIPQKYSACIRIPAGSAIGKEKTIEGIKFTLSDHKNADQVKVWMSNELPVKIENADICCQDVAKESLSSMMIEGGDQWNEIRFEKPYAIEANKDVYVGYSFVITADEDQNDEYPLLVDMASTTQDNAMYLRFSEPSDWTDFKGSQNGDLAIQLLMSGDVQKHSVGIAPSFDSMRGTKNSQITVPVTIDNRGTEGFESVDIVIDVNGQKETQNITTSHPVKGMNETYEFDLTFNTMAQSGIADVTITVDKVNGQPNPCSDNVMKGQIFTLSREAKKKIFVEEMTAFWCGGCPIGYVALQKLRKQFGEDIVLVSLHRTDPLECADYLDFMLESNVGGYYPTSHLDRTYMEIHPYAGSGKNGREGLAGFGGFGLGNDCLKLMETLPVAEVNVEGTYNGEVLTATATANYLYSGNADHALAFVVTEDGMQDESWSQSNYLKDQHGLGWENEEPLFDMWVNGESKVKGVIYDDIAVAAQCVAEGIDGSIPATVTEEEPIKYTTEFKLKDHKVIQDFDKLNIVAVIIDRATGRVVNSSYKKVTLDTGIENIGTENEAAEVARYTLDGRRISSAVKGVNIVKYSDGTVKKVVVE